MIYLLFSFLRYFFHFSRFDLISNKAVALVIFSRTSSSPSFLVCKKKLGKLTIAISLPSLANTAYRYLNTKKSGVDKEQSFLSVYSLCLLPAATPYFFRSPNYFIIINKNNGRALSFID